jgi:hypothetical protein
MASQVRSTAGAVQMRNEKGEMVMTKVKVKRYIPGQRPDFAKDQSDSEVRWE